MANFKINDYVANYNNLFIYDENGNILFNTCRPYDIDLEIKDLEIRSARKLNFSKMDVFEIKAEKNEWNRNGKDLYIPCTIISVESVTEKLESNHDGQKNYQNIYSLKLHCDAYRWERHIEKVTDLPNNMPLKDYDPNGIFSDGYSKERNTYSIGKNYKTKETCIYKRWLTYDKIIEIELKSDFYTRTEKDEARLYREQIAEIMTELGYNNKPISHYEVARFMEKLNITIK